MKNLILVCFLILQSLYIFSQTSEIVVRVKGVSSNKGYINIAIFDNQKHFLKYEKAYKTAYLKSQKQLVYIFKNIPQGEYAITVYHDINANKKLDRNFIGFPAEDYGFANSHSTPFGRPVFDDYSFNLKSHHQLTFSINLK